jgi:hypothetical protein
MALKEQEDLKREVRRLKEVLKTVRERDVQQQQHQGAAPKQGFDLRRKRACMMTTT